jgi:hypothetical protein
MGKPGWDDETWTPGRSSRGSRSDNDARNSGRPDRRYSRNEDSGGDRQPSSGRGDDWRGSSGARPASGGSRQGSGGPSGKSRSYGRDYQDPRGAARDPRRYGGEGYDPRGDRMDDRSMRSPRPPARNRPPAGGGLWTDGTGGRTNRPRPGTGLATDTRGSSMAGRPSLDALRANRLRQQGIADPEDEAGGFTVGKAFMIILLMLVLGSGSAYVYFKVSTPTVHSNINTGPASTTPSVSSASPTAIPSSTSTP